MASHFSALGLFDPERELERVFARDPVEIVRDASGAEHLRFVDASGATVVAHVVDGDIACATPFFASPDPCMWHVRAGAICVDRDCIHCSGVDVDLFEAADAPDFVTRSTVQLLHGRAFAEDAMGVVVPRAVVAFAHELVAFADEAAYPRGAVDAKLRFAVPSFMPSGMFGDVDDVSHRATAQLVGRVRSCVTRMNTIARAPFLHIVLDGLAGPVDVVADAREVDAPEPGHIVEAHAWLIADDRE